MGSVALNIVAESMDDLKKEVAGFTGAGLTLDVFSTDDILAHLRARYRNENPPLVVNVDKFESDEKPAEEKPAPETPKTRKPRTEKPAAAPPAAETAKEPEPEKPAEEKTDAAPPVVDKAAVIAALERFAASNGGQAAARSKMQEVGGSAKLADIPPEKYLALVNALAVAA